MFLKSNMVLVLQFSFGIRADIRKSTNFSETAGIDVTNELVWRYLFETEDDNVNILPYFEDFFFSALATCMCARKSS